jgi:hypothetical protein
MIMDAILNTHPSVVTLRSGDAFDKDENLVTIDQALVDIEITRLQTEYDTAQYSRDRAEAYPPMADQLDDIFHNGVDGWKATIQAVKDAHPKPV